jgi:predicted amidohydrolase
MKIGFVQFDPVFGNKEHNFKTVETLLKGCSADVIVLPELFATGYTFVNKEELSALAERKDSGETHSFVLALAQKKECCVAYGFAEQDEYRLYNSMGFISPGGLVNVYRKAHLYCDEKLFFEPGTTGFVVFKYEDTTFGMLICFDWIYPEAMRTLAVKGAQIILHGANLVMSYCPAAMITRALENHVFIVTANRTGTERRNGIEHTFIGKSQIVSPKGKVLVKTNSETCVKIVDIDPQEALDKKITERNDLLKDRRTDLYFK